MADFDSVFQFVSGKVSEVQSAASSAESELANIADGHLSSFSFSDIPEYSPALAVSPVNINVDSIKQYVGPQLTNFDPITFDPTQISGEITDLSNKVMEFIDSGGPGISQEVQDAIYQQGRERDLQTLADELMFVSFNDAMSGFPLPGDSKLAARDAVLARYSWKQSDRNRDIMALMTERAHQTAMNALNQGVSLTQIKSNLQHSIWQLYYALKGLIIDKYKAEIQGAIAEFENGIKYVLGKAGYEVEIAGYNLTLATKQAELEFETWKETVDTLTQRGIARIGQIADANKLREAAATVHAEYYKNIVSSVTQMLNSIKTEK